MKEIELRTVRIQGVLKSQANFFTDLHGISYNILFLKCLKIHAEMENLHFLPFDFHFVICP